jgi:hypothetical protein
MGLVDKDLDCCRREGVKAGTAVYDMVYSVSLNIFRPSVWLKGFIAGDSLNMSAAHG